MDKTCRHCGKVAPAENFPSAGRVKGKQYRRNICMTCYWTEVKKPRRDDNRNWYYDLKKTLKCADCGNPDFRVLDFHHLDGSDKEFNVADGAGTGLSKERILAEVAKCECLCANCHRIRTWDERQSVAQLEERTLGVGEVGGSSPLTLTLMAA